MGKAKPTKKPVSKPIKISSSLFKRRVSKNSTGQVDKEVVTAPSKTKKAPTAPPTQKKGGKDKDEPKPKTDRKRSISPTASKKVVKKKSSATPTPRSPKKGKSTSTNSRENLKNEGKGKSSSAKSTQKKKRKSSIPSKQQAGRGRRSSESSASGSSSGENSPVKSKKTINRRASRSDPDGGADSHPSEYEEEDNSSDDSGGSDSESGNGSESDSDAMEKKSSSPKKPNKTSVKKIAKKVITKKVIALIAPKKKLPVKLKQPNPSSKSNQQQSKDKVGAKAGASKAAKEKGKSKTTPAAAAAQARKAKVKPRPKFKRMASLNAKAILEASFSFENQEKRQKSPAPFGPPTNTTTTTTKVKEEEGKSQFSVSTFTSPHSSSTFIPIQNMVVKGGKGERKRKSTEAPVSNRRESNSSKGEKDGYSSLGGSRRNSSTVEKKQQQQQGGAVVGVSSPKKKIKVAVSTTSTSTGTSPPPSSSEFQTPTAKDKKQKLKKKGGEGGKSNNNSNTGNTKHKDLSVQQQQQQHQYARGGSGSGSQGTVYQPAGPLIEPHKTLPESVKLPPDLKVTYQTHPPKGGAGSSTTSTTKKHGNSSQKEKKGGGGEAGGHILHQPYKSSSSATSSRGTSYGGPTTTTTTGSPLLLHQSQPPLHSGQPHPPSASSHQPPTIPSSGAGVGAPGIVPPPPPPSAGGLFYSTSTGFAPHHSPFAPNKYPMVPPESYRTHSPYQNSFLYPSTTPQQSQYFMTPFYTPPLTPNPTPTLVGAAAAAGLGPPRPLTLHPHHHHPSITAAPFYSQNMGGASAPGIPHPSSYLVASPHHPLQPSPAPGHAGLFPHNPSTQPACPMESCLQNSTNNSNKQQQQQCVSNALHPHQGAMAMAAKQSKKAFSRPSKQATTTNTIPKQSTSPSILHPQSQPPITIQLITPNSNSGGGGGAPNANNSNAQARQLESAKNFTEQYSLPDDITITPIMVSTSGGNSTTTSSNTALLLKNTSISLINSPAAAAAAKTPQNHTQLHSQSPFTSTLKTGGKKKEKDIVHVIDPRSGHKTTIAKHISNRNLLAKANNRFLKSPQNNPTTNTTTTPIPYISPKSQTLKKLKSGACSKLNPDLDVIIIKKQQQQQQTCTINGVGDCDDSVIENLVGHSHKGKHSKQQSRRKSQSQFDGAIITQGSNKRPVLNPNDNGQTTIGNNNNSNRGPLNLSLPPGITAISSSSGSGGGVVRVSPFNQIPPALNLNNNAANSISGVENALCFKPKDGKGKRSINECAMDGLEKKRLKVLDGGGSARCGGGPTTTTPSSPLNGVPRPPHHPPISKSQKLTSHIIGNGKIKIIPDPSYSSARVREPQLNRGGTVIKSSDALAAVSAVVVDHEIYLKNSRLSSAHWSCSTKGLNGLSKKVLQKKGAGTSSGSSSSSSSSSNAFQPQNFVVAMSKLKGRGGGRNTRSNAASAKTKAADELICKNRSRLLSRGRGNEGLMRKGESDTSSNTSRSNSGVRIINGGVVLGAGVAGGSGSSSNPATPGAARLIVDRENRKYPTQGFINAVADLYQYRRNVLLRVPRSNVGVFTCQGRINIKEIQSAAAAAAAASSVTPTPTPTPTSSPVAATEKAVAAAVVAAAVGVVGKGQLSPGTTSTKSESLSTSRSGSPGAAVGAKQPVGSMAANAAKKRAGVKPLSPAAINNALLQMGLARRTPKWSNGWRFEGEPYETKVSHNNDDPPLLRRCYPAMRHESGDVIQTRDCVLLKSGSRKNDLPFIAKIAALWENPTDGEMMFSLLWYYRPEHTEMGRTKEDMPDEIFASKHIDVNSVATIDDRCFVLTFNEYCRYRKRLKQLQEKLPNKPLLSLSGTAMINNNAAGGIAGAVWDGRQNLEPNRSPSPGKISPEVVFFCRKVYDFRQKRIMKNPS